MTKILNAILAVLVIAALLPGCAVVTFQSEGIRVEGERVTQAYTPEQVGDFTKLNIELPATLYYTVGERGVRIEAYENQLPLIAVNTNSNGELVVSATGGSFPGNLSEDSTPKIYVSAPSLERLSIYAALHVAETDAIAGEKFELDVEGAMSGALDFDVDELTVNISGAADLELTGKADKAKITNAGAGAVSAFGLETTDAKVTVDGVGNVEITCTGTLDATVNGLGAISHRGGAKVTESVDGLGSVSKG